MSGATTLMVIGLMLISGWIGYLIGTIVGQWQCEKEHIHEQRRKP